jgi:prepilin-type N-terminal cleavage/methylation domain-containing protein
VHVLSRAERRLGRRYGVTSVPLSRPLSRQQPCRVAGGDAGRAPERSQRSITMSTRMLSTPADRGFTLVELLFVVALAATVMSIAVPTTRDGVESLQVASAARYLAARLSDARMRAVARSTCLGLRFVPAGSDYRFTTYVDGNDNGIRTADITAGIDGPLEAAEQLADKFPAVVFGLMNGYPDVDGQPATGTDGVRIGRARIETMSPDGTATPGTLYLHGRRTQFAVRVLGATGRVRVFEYREGEWIPR